MGLTQTRFTPRIADTAKALLVSYLTLTLAQVLTLLLAGMTLYDSVVHSFATVATGGFSPKTASVAFYDSVAIEAIIAVFMVLSGVSFSFYYLLYGRRTQLKHCMRRPVNTAGRPFQAKATPPERRGSAAASKVPSAVRRTALTPPKNMFGSS